MDYIYSTRAKKRRAFVTIAGLIPDFDGMGAIIDIEYYSKYHHIFGHNLFFGMILITGSLLISTNKKLTPLLVFLSFNLHILGDLLGSGNGWGIPYFWPINKYVFEFSAPFQWELDSWQSLLATALCILCIIRIAVKKKRTVIELVNLKADKQIVDVFNKWFKSSAK